MDQDKIKRIVLAVLLAIAGVFITHTALIEPAKSSIISADKKIEELNANLRKARGMSQSIRDLETKLADARSRVEEHFKNQPKGAPLASVPPNLESFFARQGVKAIVKSTGAPVPLSGNAEQYQVFSWSIEFATVDFIKFGTAIAAFENTYKLSQIDNITITPSSEDPALQQCSMKVSGIIRL